MTVDALRALCLRAGVTADEMRDDPDHGLVLTMAGVRKLAAMAPDQQAAAAVVKECADTAARVRRSGFKVVA